MPLFLRLVMNENMKLYKRKILWIMIFILISTISLTLAITFKSEDEPSKNWKAYLNNEIKLLETQLSDKNIPPDYKNNIQKEIELNKYRIDNDIPPLYKKTALGFVQSTVGYTGLIYIFVIILASSSVSQEYSWGTLKLILMRPVSRWKFLLAKFISIVQACLFLFLMLFLMSFVIGAIVFGFDNTSFRYVYYYKGNIYDVSIFVHFFQYFGSKFIGAVMIAAFAFMLSTVFRNNALAIALSILIQFAGSLISNILALLGKNFAKYIFFTNTNLYQYVEGSPPSGMTLSFSIIVLIIYFVLFITISIIIFEKRDIVT
jgi:ABC-2 type transport system permease protein